MYINIACVLAEIAGGAGLGVYGMTFGPIGGLVGGVGGSLLSSYICGNFVE